MQASTNEIHNKNQNDTNTDTTVQIQLSSEMANIALKRDMKYALKVA